MLIILIKNLEVKSLGFNRHLLAEWQRRKDISGAQAARKIGISEMFYSELLRGVKNPSLKMLDKISKETGLAVKDLISED